MWYIFIPCFSQHENRRVEIQVGPSNFTYYAIKLTFEISASRSIKLTVTSWLKVDLFLVINLKQKKKAVRLKMLINREFKQTTMATATGTSPNKIKGLMSKTIAMHVRYKSCTLRCR